MQALVARISKITAAQWFSSILTFDNVDMSRTFRIARRAHFAIVVSRAGLARVSARQHFLKRTLFFSMRWCIRDDVHLDSRVHAAIRAISLHQEGNMAKKAKKAKKAKSAVKKTAKKTRKVAKKKK